MGTLSNLQLLEAAAESAGRHAFTPEERMAKEKFPQYNMLTSFDRNTDPLVGIERSDEIGAAGDISEEMPEDELERLLREEELKKRRMRGSPTILTTQKDFMRSLLV